MERASGRTLLHTNCAQCNQKKTPPFSKLISYHFWGVGWRKKKNTSSEVLQYLKNELPEGIFSPLRHSKANINPATPKIKQTDFILISCHQLFNKGTTGV